ncbi:MAG: MBL fold metallo-hydrolase, partial [Bacillota bacterium]
MRLTFLGGASEIGASCTLVRIDGIRVLVDAGIRIGGRDPLPDLDGLREAGGPDAIVVTHAHTDHSGALPLVHQAFPKVPIYATEPTAQLMHVLLLDSARLMTRTADRELECPLYDVDLVSRTLARVVPVPFGTAVDLGGGVTARFFPAGHILGAAMVALEGSESALFSGDVSGSSQRTVPGMLLPPVRPDALVLESTYGGRLHPSRQREEEALARAVAEVIEGGGHALIPAFAVGRAQEVALILRAAQEKGVIPRFPVWLDGMVRAVCEVYASFPRYLRPPLDRISESGQNPFFTRKGAVQRVTVPAQRDRVLAGPPACIVSSSGMLSGGPSAYYAARLASGERNAILLCGYQDEESPGHRLLDLADAGGGILDLPEGPVELRCRVGKYSLSAHADSGELAALARHLDPAHVVLVHGDRESRLALARALEFRGTYLPENGSELDLPPFRRRTRVPAAPEDRDSQRSSPAGPLDLAAAWEKLISRGAQTVTPHDVAAAWYGPLPSPAQVQEAQRLLADDRLYFASDPRYPGLYRPRPRPQVDMNRWRQEAMEHLRGLPGHLCIVRNAHGSAQPAVAFALEQLGFHAWMVGVNGTYHYAEDLLEIAAPWEFAQDPPDAGAEKVRLYRLTREAKPLFRSLAPRDLREKMAGLPAPLSLDDLARALVSHLPGGPDSPAARLALAWRLNTSPECFERVELEPGRAAYRAREQAPDGPAAEEAADSRVEQNAALAEAEQLFPPDTGLYRKGADPQSGTITLYFHFPQVAEKKWQDRIAQLEAVTGWNVRVHPEAHMGVLAEAARRALPGGWVLLRNPSVDRDRRVVTVRCQVPDGATEEDFATARSHFREETGFDLELDGRGVPWLQAAAAADPHSGPAAASRMEIN